MVKAKPEDFNDADMFDPAVQEAYEQSLKEVATQSQASPRAVLNARKVAYSRVFKAGKADEADLTLVLNDLMYFCRVWVPTYDKRDGAQAAELALIKEGRREVFQRIKDFSCLDEDALLLKYTDALTK